MLDFPGIVFFFPVSWNHKAFVLSCLRTEHLFPLLVNFNDSNISQSMHEVIGYMIVVYAQVLWDKSVHTVSRKSSQWDYFWTFPPFLLPRWSKVKIWVADVMLRCHSLILHTFGLQEVQNHSLSRLRICPLSTRNLLLIGIYAYCLVTCISAARLCCYTNTALTLHCKSRSRVGDSPGPCLHY